MMEDALCWSAPGCDRVQLGSRDCWSRWMGVHGLTGYCGREPVRSQLFEKVDLSQFRGETVLVDANSFFYYVTESYLHTQPLYFIGDYGADVLASIRAFIMRYFHANGITSVWVHDGSFNPAKFKTQKSRRAATMTPQILVNSRVFELITTPPRAWSSEPPSFMDVCCRHIVPQLVKSREFMDEGVGLRQAFYDLLSSLEAEGVGVRQERTILEADAHIAKLCLEDHSIKAVVSSDSDFLVFDTPFLPLANIDTRTDATCPALYVPRGRFSRVFYDAAIGRLAGPATRMTKEEWESAVPLEAFRRLLPDLATLLGNDYFQPVDPDTRQTRGFVKKVTVALKRNGSQKTLDVTDKASAVEFLLLCAANGWVEAGSGMLDLEEPQGPARLLFVKAPNRLQEYEQAREQYSLSSCMACNIPPASLQLSGLAQQYASFRLAYHFADFIYAAEAGLPRRSTLINLLPLTQFAFPMPNIRAQRQVLYELLLYRARKMRGQQLGRDAEADEGEEEGGLAFLFQEDGHAPEEVLEEHVRLHPQTRKLEDHRQPFKTVKRLLVAESEAGNARQRARVEDYRASLGPMPQDRPLAERKAFLLRHLGYPAHDIKAPPLLLPKADEEGGPGRRAVGDDESFALSVLALRTLVVAYGNDGGTLLDPQQRNHQVVEALVHTVAYSLMEPGAFTSGTFYPALVKRKDYPPWLTDREEAPVGLRLRLFAFLSAYRACLSHVLDLSDVVGRVFSPASLLAINLTHEQCQRFVSRERQQAVEGLDRTVQLLKEAVSLGIEEEMERYYQVAGARAAGDEGAAVDAVKRRER